MRNKYTLHGTFSLPIAVISCWILLFSTSCNRLLTRYSMHRSVGTQTSGVYQLVNDPSVSISTDDPILQPEQPIHIAASCGSVSSIKCLLKSGASVEDTDSTGKTALHWAASRGHTNCVRELLRQGSEVLSRLYLILSSLPLV